MQQDMSIIDTMLFIKQKSVEIQHVCKVEPVGTQQFATGFGESYTTTIYKCQICGALT
jgi:hypothetical protein